MTETHTRSIVEMQQLTQEYASFSQSRGGLGNVLGGLAGVIVFAAMWILGRGIVTAVLTMGLTVLWLSGKEIIRWRLYQAFGDAREVWPTIQRRTHMIVVAILTVILVGGGVVILVRALALTTPWRIAVPYLIFCLATPWIAWRYLRTVNELMVGFYLLFASAVTSAGFVPDRLVFAAILPLYSLTLIVLGVKEHRQFQELVARLRARSGGQA